MFASGTIFSVEPPNDATRAPRPRPHREPLDQIRKFGKVGCGVHAQNRLHFCRRRTIWEGNYRNEASDTSGAKNKPRRDGGRGQTRTRESRTDAPAHGRERPRGPHAPIARRVPRAPLPLKADPTRRNPDGDSVSFFCQNGKRHLRLCGSSNEPEANGVRPRDAMGRGLRGVRAVRSADRAPPAGGPALAEAPARAGWRGHALSLCPASALPPGGHHTGRGGRRPLPLALVCY